VVRIAQSASHLEDVVAAVVVRVVTVRVVTVDARPERARRVVLQESLRLRCEFP